MRDDFIDDGPDTDEKMYPLSLPRVKKNDTIDNDKVHDTIDSDKIDKKPIISENGESEYKK